MLFHRMISLLVLTTGLLPVCVSASAAHGGSLRVPATEIKLGDFSGGDIESWNTHGFNGETRYSLLDQDGRQVLHALCQDSASGLVKEESIDLLETPLLRWSWRIENSFTGIDETTRDGDDYPASIYVAVKTGITMLSVRALHYVWSSGQTQGASWDSAFTPNVKQIAVRSALTTKPGVWQDEVRNVREDFKRYFDLDVAALDSVSLMTDCDNSDGRAEAYYGDILFSPAPTTDSYLTFEKPADAQE